MNSKKVWLVTGASKGLGLSLVKLLISRGYKVAATSRKIENMTREIESSDQFLPLEVDITNEKSVQNAITQIIDSFGTIDVVINNAGYGQIGALEELSDAEARDNFNANVFGTLNIIRSILPQLRKQGSGHIINISSVGGLTGDFPGFGVYCATKFAVAGLTESLAAELKEFGVHATVVYPGYFRTNFLEKGSLNYPQKPIEAYSAVRNSEKWHESEMKGQQPGSPEKAAVALIELTESPNIPVHFVMGSDAFQMAGNKISILQNALTQNESLSKSTDY